MTALSYLSAQMKYSLFVSQGSIWRQICNYSVRQNAQLEFLNLRDRKTTELYLILSDYKNENV